MSPSNRLPQSAQLAIRSGSLRAAGRALCASSCEAVSLFLLGSLALWSPLIGAIGEFAFQDLASLSPLTGQEGSLRAERISWSEKRCDFCELTLRTPHGSASCRQGVIEIGQRGLESQARLEEIRLDSSRIPHLSDALTCKGWSLRAPSAQVAVDSNRRMCRLQLSPIIDLACEQVARSAKSPPRLCLAQLTIGQFSMDRTLQVAGRECQLQVELADGGVAKSRVLPSQYTCRVEQVRVDPLSGQISLFPEIEVRGPGIAYRQEGLLSVHMGHLGPLGFSPQLVPERDKGERQTHQSGNQRMLLAGSGITTLSLERGSKVRGARLLAPGGFCLDAIDQSLQLLASRGDPVNFSGQIDERLVDLKGQRASIHWKEVASKLALFGTFEENVQLTLASRDLGGAFAVDHRVLSGRLAFDAGGRTLTFEAAKPELVRYTSRSKHLTLTAPSLHLEVPARGEVQLRGEGVVRAQFYLDPKFLPPLKFPKPR